MNALFITDLHLTSKPRDAYRWKLFDWMDKFMSTNPVDYLFILGDLTDAKDYHSARLVNAVVDKLCSCYRNRDGRLKYIYIIFGNHDGLDPGLPYFRFLMQFPFIRAIMTSWSEEIHGRRFLMLPHSRNPAEAWADVEMTDADYVLAHITVGGAVSESGQQLEGAPGSIFKRARRAKAILCGDVHVPQTVGDVEYIGAPYHIHFGDHFDPRVMYMKDWKFTDHYPDLMRRHTLLLEPGDMGIDLLEEYESTQLNSTQLNEGDQVKVRLRLSRSEYVEWSKYRKEIITMCEKAKIELCSLELVKPQERIKVRTKKTVVSESPLQTVERYCADNQFEGLVKDMGLELVTTQ